MATKRSSSHKRAGSGHYLNHFLKLKCSVDMQRLGLFPNVSEITESFAGYFAVSQNFPELRLDDPNVVVVSVGDGGTPRTAATFAFMSAWEAHSVDPELNTKSYDAINRLSVHRCRIEEFTYDFANRPVVIVGIHTHSKLPACLKSIKSTIRHVVVMPCCVPQTIPGRECDIDYEDTFVWSAMRRVKIWRNV